MNLTQQQRLVIDALEDVKSYDIKVFNTADKTSLFDRVVIASGTSNRHTRSMAHSVYCAAREKGLEVIAYEGQDSGEWVVLDLGSVVVHCMLPAIRRYYDLEGIWGGKPVRVKLLPLSTTRLNDNGQPEIQGLSD